MEAIEVNVGTHSLTRRLQKDWRAIAFILGALLLAEVFLAHFGLLATDVSGFFVIPVVGISVGVFAFFILFSPFFEAARKRFSPEQMLSGVGVSSLLTITAFALLFRWLGIIGPNELPGTPLEILYFSAVSFSTLGYGDFRPAEGARLLAAAQAILGNLHLGLLVATAFAAFSDRR